nr:MAG TPA: hypothetical protein [Caudoviricetes sp.]DAE76485.1 MAG TPA: hypothetical protein [Caudoviricetes sp.]DAI36939.1 MAG TPA: hypothetical protein [Caudoviricetes sp.]DAK64626.1 MAG TPA: hypothetical protein [Caudoviricetes sp.]DAM38871.1 MAG TPA: hypothetical protein [Caudoviricetes sp.]
MAVFVGFEDVHDFGFFVVGALAVGDFHFGFPFVPYI